MSRYRLRSLPPALLGGLLVAPLVLIGLLSISPTAGLDFYAAGGNMSGRWWRALATDPQWATASLTSLSIAGLSVPFALALCVPLAARWRLRRDGVAIAILASSALVLLLPPIVVALSAARLVQALGLFDTVAGVAVVHSLLAMPVMALILLSRFEACPIDAHRVAQALGAPPLAAAVTWLSSEHRSTLIGATAAGVLTSISEATVTIFITDTQVRPIARQALSGLTQDMSPVSFAAFAAWLGIAMLLAFHLEKILHRSDDR